MPNQNAKKSKSETAEASVRNESQERRELEKKMQLFKEEQWAKLYTEKEMKATGLSGPVIAGIYRKRYKQCSIFKQILYLVATSSKPIGYAYRMATLFNIYAKYKKETAQKWYNEYSREIRAGNISDRFKIFCIKVHVTV